MKQRFSWTALLLLTACLVLRASSQCSDGIVGSFAQEGLRESLTITPVEYTSDLKVSIEKDDKDDSSVQIYMVLDRESACTKDGFDIVSGTGTCSFRYTIADSKLKISGKDLDFDYADPYQASFEVRTDSNGLVTEVKVQTSSGGEVSLDKAEKCLTVATGTTTFDMVFAKDNQEPKSEECGVQYEMKGKYTAKTLTKDHGDSCNVPIGNDNDDNTVPEEGPTTASTQQPTTTPYWLTSWGWYVIGGGGLLLLIIFIAIGIVIYCRCLKKAKPDGDVEAAPEEESDIQPTDSTVTGPGGAAEQSGVEPTQQNPEDKAEEDKPEDKAEEDKPEDNDEDKPEEE